MNASKQRRLEKRAQQFSSHVSERNEAPSAAQKTEKTEGQPTGAAPHATAGDHKQVESHGRATGPAHSPTRG